MVRHFQQALTLLQSKERKQVFLLFAFAAIVAVIQTVAILSIMPFIVLLANPSILQTSEILAQFYSATNADSYHEFLLLLGFFGVLSLAVGNVALALEQWLVDRFLARLSHRLEKQLLRYMLRQPYEYFTRYHSGRLSNIVLDQVDRMVDGVIGTFIAVVSNLAFVFFIVLMLLFVSLKTTLVTLAGLLALYLFVFLLLRRKLASHGEQLTRLSGDVHAAVKETLDGIREIKTSRAETFFADRFEESRSPLSRLAVRFGILSFLPNLILETLIFSGLVAVALYFVLTTKDAGVSLSFIALYGMATYRLVPSLKSIFEGMSEIQHNADSVQTVLQHSESGSSDVVQLELPRPTRHIRFKNVSYRYPQADSMQLTDIDLTIPVGSSVCLFGESGAGKTTLLNILAVLIEPRRGELLCDKIRISARTANSWRTNFGYCPQQVFLFDDTISSNIAFGVSCDEIDQDRVREVGRLAMLEHFITTNAASGYDTVIGEGGKALSGGQRQRIGIARALYHDPDLLIFDESLVGLDSPNRIAILDNLFGLVGKTLVFSSHSEAIATRCDKVVVVENGRLVAEGQYAELVRKSPRFVELLSSYSGDKPTRSAGC